MPYSTLPTPIGELVLTADADGALTRLHLPNRPPDTAGWERDDALLEPARRQLTEYFAGERTRRSTCRCGPRARRSSSRSGTR